MTDLLRLAWRAAALIADAPLLMWRALGRCPSHWSSRCGTESKEYGTGALLGWMARIGASRQASLHADPYLCHRIRNGIAAHATETGQPTAELHGGSWASSHVQEQEGSGSDCSILRTH